MSILLPMNFCTVAKHWHAQIYTVFPVPRKPHMHEHVVSAQLRCPFIASPLSISVVHITSVPFLRSIGVHERCFFGWPAGDILAVSQLLYKVAVALKGSGGASSDYQDASSFLHTLSITLNHLNVLQTAPLDPDLANNLRELCEQIQTPLKTFSCDIQLFEPDLGINNTRFKLLAVHRKIQWALSTSEKVKLL